MYWLELECVLENETDTCPDDYVECTDCLTGCGSNVDNSGGEPEELEDELEDQLEDELEDQLEELEDTNMASGGRPSKAWLLVVFCTLGWFAPA